MFQKRSLLFGSVNGILRENNADASHLNGYGGGGGGAISESKSAWWEGSARSSLTNRCENKASLAPNTEGAARNLNGSSYVGGDSLESKPSAVRWEGAARSSLANRSENKASVVSLTEGAARSSLNNNGFVSRAWPPQSDASAVYSPKVTTKTKSTLTVSGGVSGATVTPAIGSTNMGLTTPPLEMHAKKMEDGKNEAYTCYNGNEWDQARNGNEDETDTSSSDSEYDYGPGIVNRLKAKFITLSLPTKPVRRVASLEHLLDVEEVEEFRGGLVDRTKFFYEQNVRSGAVKMRGANNFSKFSNNSGSLKRARSMDNVMGAADKNYFNAQNNLRNAFLQSKKIIIIEQPKSSAVNGAKIEEKTKNAPNGRCAASPSCLIDELPMPNKVKECLKLFEHSDENKNINSAPAAPVNHVINNNNKPKILPKARAAAIFAEKVETTAPSLPLLPPSSPIINDTCEIETVSNVKSRIDAFANKLSKSTTNTTCANSAEGNLKAIVPVIPSPRETKVVEEEEKREPPPKIVDHVPALTNGCGGISVKLRAYQPLESSNSVVIRFDDDKPRPHLPNISKKFGNDEVDYEDEDDEAAYDASEAASFSFIGANVIIGKSSLLKTRNKKLQLLFDDKAISTYEYLSESAVMSDDENDTTSSCDTNGIRSDSNYESHTNKLNNSISGGLGNYTPLAVSNDQVFELGISRAPLSTTSVVASNTCSPPAATATTTTQNGEEDDSALSLKPAAEEDNVLWSCTQTSDILF